MALQLANLADRVPLSGKFKAKERILKLAQFGDSFKTSLRNDYKVKAPVDTVALVFLVIVASYLPSLVLSLILRACGFGGPPNGLQQSADPAQFQFNVPEFGEISVILRQVQGLQKEIQDIKRKVDEAPQQQEQP